MSADGSSPGQPELAILVGLPGSGKTSFVRAHLSRHVHVSKDLMPHARARDGRQLALVKGALAAGRSVVVDNINPRVADRAPLIAAAREHHARVVGYMFEADVKECLQRNRQRQGRARVPDVAIFTTARRMEPPAPEEGFDEIVRVRLGEGGFSVEPAPAQTPP
jgi:predicted kinase